MENKFRLWDDESKKHIYFDFYDIHRQGYQDNEVWIKDVCIEAQGSKNPHIVFEYFTDLKDKNGKEAYEGDKFYTQTLMSNPGRKHNISYWINVTCVIILKNGRFVGEAINNKVHYCELIFKPKGIIVDLPINLEIIGSIHDNPELLEKS